MRVLFLTHRLPYAPNRGDRIRAFHIVKSLAARDELELVSLVHDRDELAQVPRLEEMGVRVTAVPVTRLRNLAMGAAQLAGARPLTHSLLDAPDLVRAIRGIAQQLERGPIIARRAQRDAPVGHRHVRIELERLGARPLRFLEPERVDLRHALQEELARLLRRGRDREVPGDAHARQELRRQQRLRARRHHAHFGLPRRGRLLAPGHQFRRSGRGEKDREGGGKDRFHAASIGGVGRTGQRN